MGDFKVIIITPPDVTTGYVNLMNDFLESDAVDYLHLRKPDCSHGEMRTLIECVKPEFRHRLTLHSHFELAEEFNVGGLHLNSRAPQKKNDFQGRLSKSCHSIEELSFADCYDYVTFSPIFDSISKLGYVSTIDFDQLAEFVKERRIVALGGITPEKIPMLRKTGFFGAAMLGAITEGIERKGENEIIKELLQLRE